MKDQIKEIKKGLDQADKEVKDQTLRSIMLEDIHASISYALMAQRYKLTKEQWYRNVMSNKNDAPEISKRAVNKNKSKKEEKNADRS